MAATAVTLKGHSPVAGLFKCICAPFYTISTDSVLARFLCISRASCISNSTTTVGHTEGLSSVNSGIISGLRNGSRGGDSPKLLTKIVD